MQSIRCICSIVVAVRSDIPDGVHLVFGDVSSLSFGSHPPGSEEYHTKQQFLSQCVCALKVNIEYCKQFIS